MDFTLIVLSILSLLTPSCNASSSQAAEWTETTVPNYSDSEQSLTLPSSLPTPGSDVDRFIRDESQWSRLFLSATQLPAPAPSSSFPRVFVVSRS